jgi:hypothetical protein
MTNSDQRRCFEASGDYAWAWAQGKHLHETGNKLQAEILSSSNPNSTQAVTFQKFSTCSCNLAIRTLE